jgi:hypothetical protein
VGDPRFPLLRSYQMTFDVVEVAAAAVALLAVLVVVAC